MWKLNFVSHYILRNFYHSFIESLTFSLTDLKKINVVHSVRSAIHLTFHTFSMLVSSANALIIPQFRALT